MLITRPVQWPKIDMSEPPGRYVFWGFIVLQVNSVLECIQCLSKCVLYVSLISLLFASQFISFRRIMPAPRSAMPWRPVISLGQTFPEDEMIPSGFLKKSLRVSSVISVGLCPHPSGQGSYGVPSIFEVMS